MLNPLLNTADGIGILNVAAQPQSCGFFVPIAQLPIMAGWAEQPQGWPGATPVCQLRSVRLPMIGIVRSRVYNPIRVAIMNVTLTGAIRPAKPNKIPGFVNEVNGKYRATKTLTDQQIINAAQAILNNRFRPGVLITSWDAMETWLQLHYQNFDIEVFVGIFLTTNHYIIAHEILFRGTLDAASVYPREIAKRALQLNAGAIIFAHNHPSGIIDPSPGDEDITRKLKASLALFDITVLDHFVIGKGGAFSFANHNLL